MPGDARDTHDAVVARLRAAGCVFAEDEARLLVEAAGTPGELDMLVDRRAAGEPLEQILGWAEFYGLRIHVEPGVFVPRRRTELLVREAVALARTGDVVLDLCCGSGAVGVAVATAVDGVELHAADIDPAAVRCARRTIGHRGTVHQGDLYAALPPALRARVGVLVVNAPYVPTLAIATMPPEARDHEPRVSLDGGPDGLDVHRRVARDARRWLAPSGHLLVETGAEQAAGTARILEDAGLTPRIVHSAEVDGTVVVGRRRR